MKLILWVREESDEFILLCRLIKNFIITLIPQLRDYDWSADQVSPPLSWEVLKP